MAGPLGHWVDPHRGSGSHLLGKEKGAEPDEPYTCDTAFLSSQPGLGSVLHKTAHLGSGSHGPLTPCVVSQAGIRLGLLAGELVTLLG